MDKSIGFLEIGLWKIGKLSLSDVSPKESKCSKKQLLNGLCNTFLKHAKAWFSLIFKPMCGGKNQINVCWEGKKYDLCVSFLKISNFSS